MKPFEKILLVFLFVGIVVAVFYNSPAKKYVPPTFVPVKKGRFYCEISDTVFGIDVSHHQGTIDWVTLKKEHPEIEFAYIRCAAGPKKKDRMYKRNVAEARKVGIKTGAYIYYYANTNSPEQFNHFKRLVDMTKHELAPVLDIEKPSKYGDESLRAGLANWLELAEQEYGVQPVLYTNLGYYNQRLKGYFNSYPKWIAAYSRCPSSVDWSLHQYSETGRLKGIKGYVDLDYGNSATFQKLLR